MLKWFFLRKKKKTSSHCFFSCACCGCRSFPYRFESIILPLCPDIMSRQQDEQRSMNKLSGNSNAEKATELRKYDQKEVQERMAKLRNELVEKKEAEKKKLAEIAAVEVNAADVSVIASELNISEADAKWKLQEKKNDVVAVLREAVHLPTQKK
ncbi:hypothetical protein STCU_07522 [Strigomonas culicis]|uniref:Nascent polypeptide-associated complex subunit alpha-like UBA domain-containing protein n=1 Tax=Strigomonas culicis TaxID=28005 RepID=S9U457_9TRYP|nr:hypothetical protein STCU_07522 [Strigomonas culicis]|eukprot:EPY23718.1 hypothetical protein STCU_07522 [Strigomonas culicis]